MNIIDLSSVTERLRAQSSGFKQFGGAAEFEAAVDGAYTAPAAFVIPLRDDTRPNQYGNQITQQEVITSFSIVIAAKNVADLRGQAALDALKPLRESVLGALLGWVPGNCVNGCEFGGGRLRAFDNQVLWWDDVYRSAFYIRSTP